jgi:ubiquinone/menaquinone biosynthesis C-methylase UbiE
MSGVTLVLRAAGLYLRGRRADPIPDYDLASTAYDDFFSDIMGVHGVSALDEVPIRAGDTVVELACGTGHLTGAVARRLGGAGSIRAVDMSGGMLAVARRRLAAFPQLDIAVEQGDMLEFIRRQPDASADLVVCGWAICYTRPVRLLEQVARVLRPGGHVVVIETRADALVGLRKALEAVLAKDPSMMTRVVHVSLPSGPKVLRKWFDAAGLRSLALREGEQALPWDTAAKAVDWVERSGAAAGFRDAIDPSRQAEVRTLLRAELDDRLTADPTLRFHHTFVVGVAARTVPTAAGTAGSRPADAVGLG